MKGELGGGRFSDQLCRLISLNSIIGKNGAGYSENYEEFAYKSYFQTNKVTKIAPDQMWH